jgi:hypothetical protein
MNLCDFGLTLHTPDFVELQTCIQDIEKIDSVDEIYLHCSVEHNVEKVLEIKESAEVMNLVTFYHW